MLRIFKTKKYYYFFSILLVWSLCLYFYSPNIDHWNSYLFQLADKDVTFPTNQLEGGSNSLYDRRKTSPNDGDFLSIEQKNIYIIFDLLSKIFTYFNYICYK